MEKKMIWRIVGMVFLTIGVLMRLIFSANEKWAENPYNWIIIGSIVVGFFFIVLGFILTEKKELGDF